MLRYDGAVTKAGLFLALVLMLASCDSNPPSWESLLSARIRQEYPAYTVTTAPGKLVVERPGRDSQAVNVDEIAAFCRRGPRDCEYAKDQMLITLR
ncbi:MAG: hypothetical protein EON92_02150 [Burkholderiales bacterium]|nr:MAG: hypothetical protein EON92_02150 [Burkholderiales bacterium]